ncbi:hypothetical protein CLOP_g17277 [Closterium sp. NIES-67]|nr:hypothetical protein CLOP_g17277 [Closterium sp. NIES-67]
MRSAHLLPPFLLPSLQNGKGQQRAGQGRLLCPSSACCAEAVSALLLASLSVCPPPFSPPTGCWYAWGARGVTSTWQEAADSGGSSVRQRLL